MIIPPVCAPVTVLIDGSVVRSYRAPFVRHGRVMAPVDPFIVDVAASVEYADGTIVVRRADRFAQVPATAFVEIGPLLRTLGLTVSYDARSRRVSIDIPPLLYATPTPFNPAVPLAAPRAVFTPTPAVTPKPAVTGTPSPRRTPLPVNEPLSQPSP